MRHWSRLTGTISALAGVSSLIRVPPSYGIVLVPLKLLSTALSPWMAVLGGLSLFAGLRRRDRRTTVLGTLGLLSAGLHSYATLRRRADPLAAAFGPDWRAHLSASSRARLQSLWRPPRGVRRLTDLTIGTAVNGAPLLADVWLPPTHVQPSGVGLIFLHGSSWYYFNKDLGTRPLFRYLAAQGHVIVDVAYTLAPHADLAGMVAEVRQAQQWLRSVADTYGVDPARIVLGGGSAGAHLALLAAYTATQPEQRVRGVIAWYGVSELLTMQEHLRTMPYLPEDKPLHRLSTWILRRLRILSGTGSYVNAADLLPRLLGASPYEAPFLYEAWSPLTYVGPDTPPTLLLHGQMDSCVPVAQSRYLRSALQSYKVPVALLEVPYAEHDFDIVLAHAAHPGFRAALPVVAGFLALMASA